MEIYLTDNIRLKDDIMELGYKAAQVDNLFESSNITQ